MLRTRAAIAVLAACLVCAGAAAARTRHPRAAVTPAITLAASAPLVTAGGQVTLSGAAPPGGVVTLYASPYPYGPGTLVATATASTAGAFSFTEHPDRNTRYEAALGGTSATAKATVDVTGTLLIKVRRLPLGRAMITILVFHPADLDWNGARAHWYFASAGGGFIARPWTDTGPLGPHVTLLRIIEALPAGRYGWSVCFHASTDHALADPGRPKGCSGRGYRGTGFLPVGYPGPAAISRATQYLATRLGRTAFAVLDSEGRLSGVNVHWTFPTASVVKAMLLVGYLRRLDALGQHHVDSYSNSFLYPMIHVSDNNAATTCWTYVGDSGLYQVAAAAGMTDFSVNGLWGTALLSPADQARFFFEMDSLIPREFVGYARFLLSTIVGWQSWGVPVIARPLGYQVFFKDGSEPTGLGQLVHQIARLEGNGRTFSIAVMTDGDPTMQYGIDTIQGVTAALL
jgi:hypothetical protein